MTLHLSFATASHDTVHVHSSHPTSLDNQHGAHNTDNPPTGTTHGNPDVPVDKPSIKKQIPISAPQCHHTDDQDGQLISCSNALHLFHNHRKCNSTNKSDMQLSAAVRKGNDNVNTSVILEGEGCLSIPAMNSSGCIAACAACIPHLTLTLMNENTKEHRSS